MDERGPKRLRDHRQRKELEGFEERLERLLGETPSGAQERCRRRFEQEVTDRTRVWMHGRGILARRVREAAQRAGVRFVGSTWDLERIVELIQKWPEEIDDTVSPALPTDFSLLSTQPPAPTLDPQPSWQDFAQPQVTYFHALAWRFPQSCSGLLFVMHPRQRLRYADQYREVYGRLDQLASRDTFLARLELALGQSSGRRSPSSALPVTLAPENDPTPVPVRAFEDLSLRFRSAQSEWVFDFCRPGDDWCEKVLRRRDPSGWQRIRFHPEGEGEAQRGWLWARHQRSEETLAANQTLSLDNSGRRLSYRKDMAQELGLGLVRTVQTDDERAWRLLETRDPGAPSVLRFQSFEWEPFCPWQARRLGALIARQPKWELRWETPHALELLRAWLELPGLLERAWEIEGTENPNLDAVVVRRSGR